MVSASWLHQGISGYARVHIFKEDIYNIYYIYWVMDNNNNNGKKKYFNVLEVADFIGISRQTIVRYEKRGIFPKPRRNLVNKWREYTQKDIDKLRSILGRMEA